MLSPLAPPSPATATRRRRAADRGFTLIELMIVIVVVGLLAMVAYPSYQDSIRKGRRAEAVAALTQVQQAQERWRGNNAAYASLLTAAPTATPPGLGLPATTVSGYYALSLSGTSATGYTVTAAGVTGTSQASDGSCTQLRVRMADGNIFYGSASAGSSTFDEGANSPCWSR